MYEMQLVRRMAGTAHVCFLILAVLTTAPTASGQEDLSGLTEEQLIVQYHREAYREEFMQRLGDYSQEERIAAMERLRDTSGRRQFPVDYNEDELFERIRDSRDRRSYRKAQDELKKRYEDSTSEELVALFERLRAEYRATPYPVFDGENLSDPTYRANRAVFNGLNEATRNVLPEELALELFREVYLNSGQKGAITKFLGRIDNKLFRGPATLAVLEELRDRTASYDEKKLDELGENEAVESIVYMAIRACSDNSFEAIKARQWRKNDLDIYAMGNFDNPEARALLLELYETIPKERLSSDKRLRVLSALIIRWDRERDIALRELLRRELTELLNMDHTENLYYLGKTVKVIEETGDPYYIPLLKKRRANIDLATIRRASPFPENISKGDIDPVLKNLDEAIKVLEDKAPPG